MTNSLHVPVGFIIIFETAHLGLNNQPIGGSPLEKTNPPSLRAGCSFYAVSRDDAIGSRHPSSYSFFFWGGVHSP